MKKKLQALSTSMSNITRMNYDWIEIMEPLNIKEKTLFHQYSAFQATLLTLLQNDTQKDKEKITLERINRIN